MRKGIRADIEPGFQFEQRPPVAGTGGFHGEAPLREALAVRPRAA